MKKIIYIILISLVGGLAGCSNKKNRITDESERKALQLDTVAAGGVQRMQVSRSEQDIRYNGADYHVLIQRVPSDTLSVVKNDRGEMYADNEIMLRITRGKNEKIFSRLFTKKSFASLLAPGFLTNSILEGMVFDKVSPQGLVFAASVSFPQTDLYVPLSITVGTNGKMQVTKEDQMDENYDQESME